MLNSHLCLRMSLILSGDASLNREPVNRHQIKNYRFDFNINILLPKIDELLKTPMQSNRYVRN